MKDKSV